MAGDSIHIKGFAIRGLLRYVKESDYPGGIPVLLEHLEPGAAPFFSTKILSSRWYPYEAFIGLLRTIDAELGRGDHGLMPEIGEASGRQDAGTIFRVVAAFSSVEAIVRRSDSFWQRYCDRGRFEIVDAEKGRLLLALDGFPEVARIHCALIAGWIRGIGLSVGARQPVVEQVRCVHEGDARCEFAGTWGA